MTERIAIVLKNLEFARDYTLNLLDGLDADQWFWSPQLVSPSQPHTHIAWQVGHLAMAQYGLCLFRQRGRKSEDTELMSSKFRKLFMKGTTAAAREGHPSPEEIRQVLDRVFQQAKQEIPGFPDEDLNQEIDPPTAAYPTRFGCLLMAVNHEMLHAGQIGLLRRLMGLDPIR